MNFKIKMTQHIFRTRNKWLLNSKRLINQVIKNIMTILCLLLFARAAPAQETAEDKWGSWITFCGRHTLSDTWKMHSLLQLRTYESLGNFNMLIISLGGSYSLGNHLSVGMRYGYLHWDSNFKQQAVPNTNEYRVSEYLGLNSQWAAVNLYHCLSMEHRYIDNISSRENQHRVRYKLQAKIPVSKQLFAMLGNEVFFNLDGFAYQQNRFYGGLGIRASKTLDFRLGYMKHSFTNKSYDRLQITVFIKTGSTLKS